MRAKVARLERGYFVIARGEITEAHGEDTRYVRVVSLIKDLIEVLKHQVFLIQYDLKSRENKNTYEVSMTLFAPFRTSSPFSSLSELSTSTMISLSVGADESELSTSPDTSPSSAISSSSTGSGR